MKSAKSIVTAIRAAFPGKTCFYFQFPTLHLVVEDEAAADKDDDEREDFIAERARIEVADLRQFESACLANVRLLTPSERAEEYPEGRARVEGHHWLARLADDSNEPQLFPTLGTPVSTVKVLHFYGYKGGQARSSVLATLARFCAASGQRVLIVDSDIEAPSLHRFFDLDVPDVDASLLGFNRGATSVQPLRAFEPKHGQGIVDIIPARPSAADHGLEVAAFALRVALDSSLLANAAVAIMALAEEQRYDAIFVDHRAGISAATFPWLDVMRGGLVLCVRLDNQWRTAESFLNVLIKTNPHAPLAIVSYNQFDEEAGIFRQRSAKQIEDLLNLAGAARSFDTEDGERFEPSPDLLDRLHVIWPSDNRFKADICPSVDSVGSLTRDALLRLAEVLELIDSEQAAIRSAPLSTGARASGDFVQTDAMRSLYARSRQNWYVFGRKGTGKTTLARELGVQKLATPLIGDRENVTAGIPSIAPELVALKELIGDRKDRAEIFWWNLLAIYSRCRADAERPELVNELNRTLAAKKNILKQLPALKEIASALTSGARCFSVDCLETAFKGTDEFREYIPALFDVLSVVDSDERLKILRFRLFMRSDLAQLAGQNIEQQLAGKVLELKWGTQAIFNYVLLIIEKLDWFAETFPKVVYEIKECRTSLIEADLSVAEAQRLLLKIFPESIRKFNIQTMTFLRTYFSDSSSNLNGEENYYPRIYNEFITYLNERGRKSPQDVLERRRLSSQVIVESHRNASSEYLLQVKQELEVMLQLPKGLAVSDILGAFAGEGTPFVTAKLRQSLVKKLASRKVSAAAVEEILTSMKDLGIFEDRPGYDNQWRAGRLFKESLGMKFSR